MVCSSSEVVFVLFFSSVEHGGSTKGFKKTKEERSESIFVSMLYIHSEMLSFRTDILRSLVIRFKLMSTPIHWCKMKCSFVVLWFRKAACRNFSQFTEFFLTWIECVQLFLVVLVTRRQSRTHKRRKRSRKVPEMELSFQELNDDERKSGIFHR